MTTIDRDLVRAINSGRCFALVGAGPSCELGAPSWRQLAQLVIDRIAPLEPATAEQCSRLLTTNDYPKIFSLAERVLGRDGLLSLVNGVLGGSRGTGRVYQYIASWPFSCYLTTNFDDHLQRHLDGIGLSPALRRNSRDDMLVLRADTKNVVFKIHGDTTVPEDIVLTSEQYSAFRHSPSRDYWREKIRSALHMMSLVIFGYSISDPDFQDQLTRAKEVASPDHPVFMFAADIPIDQVWDYYQRFNIRIIPYNTQNGSHHELVRLLRRYDPFIAKRGTSGVGLEPVDEEKANLAASMYLFTQLRAADSQDTYIEKTYSSLILQTVSQQPPPQRMDMDGLQRALAARTFAATGVDPSALGKAIDSLYMQGYVIEDADGSLSLTRRGAEAVATIKAERDLLREKFRLSCQSFLMREYPGLDKDAVRAIVDALLHGLVLAYEKRGIEIARAVFSDGVVDISDATDVLEVLNAAGSALKHSHQKAAFADLMLEVILRPDQVMKEHLAALSQGYFAYHALGLEPRCSQARVEMAKMRGWVLDSSILLPILAVGSANHLYAVDLLRQMRLVGICYYTTDRLLDEVRDHAWWAIANFAAAPPDDSLLLQAAMAGPGFKHNLFLDGYVSWAPEQGVPSFDGYLRQCLGTGYHEDLLGAVRRKASELGIDRVDVTKLPEFSQEMWPRRDEIASQIEKVRREYGTYKSEAQCVAEAEVALIAEMRETGFLSQSNVLNRLQDARMRVAWRPEGMYRLLSLFSSLPPDASLLYNSMMQDFYYAGFDIVDKAALSRYASPMIRQSRMQLEQSREEYSKAISAERFNEVREAFERVPDEQKPFYTLQVVHYVAAQEIVKREAAEARVRRLEGTKDLTVQERTELARLRSDKAERQQRAQKKRTKQEAQARKKHRRKK